MEALAQGDLQTADELMGGLLGRAFGGFFAAELAGAEFGLAFGLPGALLGAVLGGIVGAIGGNAIGEFLFGEMHELGLTFLDRFVHDLVKNVLSDPIILDLDGDGIELVALAGSVARFDLDGDGVVERTGWVSPHDGLLFQDSNHNGLVDGVGELFGAANVDGYDELETLDSNHDGRIDAADPAFADLRVWRDLNSDGISTPDEIITLAQAGITRFDLGYAQADTDVGGNFIARTGSYGRADGSSGAMASVRFALDETAGRPHIPQGTDIGDLAILPNLPATAALGDLQTAMFFDPVLKAMVEDLVYGAHDFHRFQDFAEGGFIDVLYRWAGVDTSVPEDPANPYYLHVFEALTGLPLVFTNDHQRDRLAEQWPWLVKQFGVQFLLQAAHNPELAPLYEAMRGIAALDPAASDYIGQAAALASAATAAGAASEPAYDYLKHFSHLTLDPATGGVAGDFDAIVADFLKTQPSFFAAGGFASEGGGGGGGGNSFGTIEMTVPGEVKSPATVAAERNPWTAWYEDQGSLLFTIAAAMGIGQDYVLNATGWRWLVGDVTRHHGAAGADLLDFNTTYYDKVIALGGELVYLHLPTQDQMLFGGGGDDTLIGNDGVDRLLGGPGNDLLKGGTDSDMYVYAAGDGLDRIVEEGGTGDAIYFSTELNRADLRVARIAGTDDLLLHFGDTSQGIILTGQWASGAVAVEQLHFVGEDGMDSGDIASLYLATLTTAGDDLIVGSWAGERMSGAGGNDIIGGRDGDDRIDGGSGNDGLWGDDGNDILMGGAGADHIEGGDGDDILIGGPGNDDLRGDVTYWGSGGNDTYVYNPGDGDDVIYDWVHNGSDDTLVFGDGIAPEDLILSRMGDWADVRITFAGMAGSIVIDNQWHGESGIEHFEFAGAAPWDKAAFAAEYVRQQQTATDDVIFGTLLPDAPNGGAGDDYIETREGNDVLDGGTGNDWLVGGGGNDTLIGGTGNDILRGDDTFYGDGGDDTYIYNPGDGDDILYDWAHNGTFDTLILGAGIAPEALILDAGANSNDLKISFAGLAGSITIQAQWLWESGIESIQFMDAPSVAWDKARLAAEYIAQHQNAGNAMTAGESESLLDGATAEFRSWQSAGHVFLDTHADSDSVPDIAVQAGGTTSFDAANDLSLLLAA